MVWLGTVDEPHHSLTTPGWDAVRPYPGVVWWCVVTTTREAHAIVSIYPCDLHGARVRGSLDAAYITVLHGSSSHKRRLRVCSTDLSELLDSHSDTWTEAGDDVTEPGVLLCSTCKKECNEPASDLPVFVTVFARSAESATEYFGVLHAG